MCVSLFFCAFIKILPFNLIIITMELFERISGIITIEKLWFVYKRSWFGNIIFSQILINGNF
jgi:hypothetical protein